MKDFVPSEEFILEVDYNAYPPGFDPDLYDL